MAQTDLEWIEVQTGAEQVQSRWKRILFGFVCLDICVRTILAELGKPESFITYVQDRLGHDRRYGIDAAKITRELGWRPKYHYETGIERTIQWYLANQDWWTRIQSGAYQEYYTKQSGSGLGV